MECAICAWTVLASKTFSILTCRMLFAHILVRVNVARAYANRHCFPRTPYAHMCSLESVFSKITGTFNANSPLSKEFGIVDGDIR